MIGSGDPTPFDLPLTALLAGLAVFFLVGAARAHSWTSGLATLLRRVGLVLAIAATGAVHVVTPTTNGIIGAGRLFTVWPAFGLAVLAYAAWAWRAGRP